MSLTHLSRAMTAIAILAIAVLKAAPVAADRFTDRTAEHRIDRQAVVTDRASVLEAAGHRLHTADATSATLVADDTLLTDFSPEPGVAATAPDRLAKPTTDGASVAISGATNLRSAGRAATGPAVAGSDRLKGGVGCSIQCITSGNAYARGIDAELRLTTDTPATIHFIVHDGHGGYHEHVISPGGLTEFSHRFEGLDPGTRYHVTAAAEDGDGFTSRAFGEFETLVRNVEISLTGAEMLRMANDDLAFSAWVWVDGGFVDGHHHASLAPYRGVLDWPDSLVHLADTDRYLDLAVQVREFNPHARRGANEVQPGSPSKLILGPSMNPFYYYAYAELRDGENDLDARPAGATSWLGHTIERTLVLPSGGLPPGAGSPVNFRVPVTIDVTYEPTGRP
ncbi:MAG: hypothetical protein AAGA93_12525 [Actinomycetota bacterium]